MLLGNYGLTNQNFNCPSFATNYEAWLKGDLSKWDSTGLKSGQTEQSVDTEADSEVNSKNDTISSLITTVLDIIGFPNMPTLYSSPTNRGTLKSFYDGLRVKIIGTMMSLPFVKELGYLFYGIEALVSPCAGISGISFLFLTPVVLGMMYIIMKLVRGGG